MSLPSTAKLRKNTIGTKELSAGKRRLIPQNANVWEPEDFADKIYLIEKGRVRIVELRSDGNEILLENIAENDFFGESSFLYEPGERRKTLARAARDCVIVEFNVEIFSTLIFQDAGLLRDFVASVSNRLMNVERRVAILTSRAVEKRLGRILLFLTENHGIKTNPPQKGKMKIFVTHEELSDLTAISRQRITKTMNHFRKMSLVEYERTKPLVIDIPALETYLETQD